VVALGEPGSDKIVEHLHFEAVAEHQPFQGDAVRIEGEQLECSALVIRQTFLWAPRLTELPALRPS
jgi:hypothetical protein